MSASVSYPSFGLVEEVITSLRVTQQEYRHDVAVFEVPVRRSERTVYAQGSPVTITWTKDRNEASFYGYIHHTEPGGSQTDSTMRVFCKGASMLLEDGILKSWKKRTVTSIAAEIARGANFDSDIVGHPQVFNSLSASGGRYWDFLVERSKEIGYSFYCTNTKMVLHPRTHLVKKLEKQAPVLYRGAIGERGTLHDFVPMDGAPPGKGRARMTTNGINPRTGKPFSVSVGPPVSQLGRKAQPAAGTRFTTSHVASDPNTARYRLVAQGERDRYYITATAYADGFPQVTQTTPVILAAVDPLYEGTWFVRKVTHIHTLDEYLMEMELGRDALGATSPPADPRAKRIVATRGNPQGRPKSAYPRSKLAGGIWKAEWSTSSRTFSEAR